MKALGCFALAGAAAALISCADGGDGAPASTSAPVQGTSGGVETDGGSSAVGTGNGGTATIGSTSAGGTTSAATSAGGMSTASADGATTDPGTSLGGATTASTVDGTGTTDASTSTGGATTDGAATTTGGVGTEPPASLPPTEDYSDFGPFETTSEGNTGPDGTYTIVRPETLGEDGFLHAPLIFGPGIGGAPSSMMSLLERIASHGFVIISRQLDGGPGDAENNRRMIDGLDWLIEQNTTAGSTFEGKLAVEHAVSMGYSVGGTAAVDVGGHDAIVTVVSIHGHQAKPLEESSATFLLMGGTDDIMGDGQSWLAPTYEALEAQTFFSLVEGADHGYIGRTVDGVPGGVETPAMIAWLRYWVYDDQGAKQYFYGDDCVMCESPWTNTQRKNWD